MISKQKSNSSNGGLILYADQVGELIRLGGGTSESSQLIRAMYNIRFCGADPEREMELLPRTPSFMLGLMIDRIKFDMEAYQNRCEQNRINASKSRSRTKKVSEVTSSESEKVSETSAKKVSSVTGGGLILYENQIREISRMDPESDLSVLLTALSHVRFQCADPEAEKEVLPFAASCIFGLMVGRVQGDMEAYRNRCEQNRINASRSHSGKNGNSAAIQDDKQSEAVASDRKRSLATAQTAPGSSDESASPTPKAEKRSQLITSESAEIAEEPSNYIEIMNIQLEPSEAIASDRQPSLATAANMNMSMNMNINNHTPPTPPLKGREYDISAEEISVLNQRFDVLWDAYPKWEDLERSRKAFFDLRPGEQLMEEILSGLEMAKRIDKRFQGEPRFIPMLGNWLKAKGWRASGIYLAGSSNQNTSKYASRPLPTNDDLNARNLKALQILQKRYGEEPSSVVSSY